MTRRYKRSTKRFLQRHENGAATLFGALVILGIACSVVWWLRYGQTGG